MLTRRRLLALAAALPALRPLLARAEDEAPPVSRRFLMADVNGVVVTDETLIGRFALIYFGYTGCPDICPTSLITMGDVLQGLGADADRLLALFVTLDPERDTAKRLSLYATSFDARIVALRGPVPHTESMARAFGVTYRRHVPDPAHPEEYSIDHTTSLIFLGPDGTLIRRFPHDMEPARIIAEIRTALAAVPPS